jgi:hypothetical protein
MVAHIPGKKWEDKPEITEEERKLFTSNSCIFKIF